MSHVVEVDIAIEDGRWTGAVADLEGLVTQAVEAALAVEAAPAEAVAISLLLTDDAAVRDLNRTWRGQDKATNVLSFPSGSPAPPHGARPLGDVVLAYDTMVRESDEARKPLADHLAHLVVHGTLHLLGLDHETGDAEADAMERLETLALRRIGVPDPYGDAA